MSLAVNYAANDPVLLLRQGTIEPHRQHVHIPGDGVEWSAKLVTHDAEEICLGAISRLCFLPRRVKLAGRAPPLGYRRTEQCDCSSENSHERLQREQALVELRPHERASPDRRLKDRDRCYAHCRTDCTAKTETQRRPDERWEEHVFAAASDTSGRFIDSEDDERCGDHCDAEGDGFRCAQSSRPSWSPGGPSEDQCSHEENPDCIAKPPRSPDR